MSITKEYETALLIVPPQNVQAFAYPLRELYDSEWFNRVPAHITLLYPFVPPDRIDAAVTRLTPICSVFPPFDIVLDRYGRFEDTLFLEPSNPEKLSDLHQRLTTSFPDYPVYQGEHGQELHPHVTLARFNDPKEAEAIIIPPAPCFNFEVKQLHIYLGCQDDQAPYIPRVIIPLGQQVKPD